MSAYEFVESLFNEAGDDQLITMTIEAAEADLENFERSGWDIPEDLTPEEYADLWNEMLAEWEEANAQ